MNNDHDDYDDDDNDYEQNLSADFKKETNYSDLISCKVHLS